MCLVIDTCCLSRVLNQDNREHHHFVPIFDWLINGDGSLIYGGTKYNAELRRADGRILEVLKNLERRRHMLKLDDSKVDAVALTFKARVTDRRFNDEHLASLVIVSGCRIVCTKDDIAIFHLKRPELFSPYNRKRPKIYSSNANRKLCCGQNIVGLCRGRSRQD